MSVLRPSPNHASALLCARATLIFPSAPRSTMNSIARGSLQMTNMTNLPVCRLFDSQRAHLSLVNRRGRRRRPIPFYTPLPFPLPISGSLFLFPLLRTTSRLSCRSLCSHPESLFSDGSQGLFFTERKIGYQADILRLR